MGLVIFGMGLLYLLISIGIVMWVVRYARKNNKSTKRWGVGAALVMYLLVFWDHIPTIVAHKYYCDTEAGFWIYKTVDEWKAENPGVMETLVANSLNSSSFTGDNKNSITTFFWNSRINHIIKRNGPLLFHRWRVEEVLLDTVTDEILARSVDFSTSYIRRQAGWTGWKFWLDNKYCTSGREAPLKGFIWMTQFKGNEK